jgi:transcriptional regulator with XRE-family HTH domain
MKHDLCENIKKYRKARKLTQEQLAEAVGVTVGTVSKWENANCIPDISMIMELADFFEISVDVLVGFDTPLKKVPEILERIEAHYKKHEMEEAITECSKALTKFPNNFDLLMNAATIRYVLWYETSDESMRAQAKELFQKAQLNIPDDNKKTRNEFAILHNLALLEKNTKKKIELLESINIKEVFDAEIGEVYRDNKDNKKAYEFFSEGLYLRSIDVINVTGRWIWPLIEEKKYDTALDLISYSETIIKTLYEESKSSIGIKMLAYLKIIEAVIFEILSRHEDMEKDVETAVRYAKAFDENPAYELKKGARLWLGKSAKDNPVAFDDQGPSAMKAIEKLVNDFQKEHRGAEKNAAKKVHEFMMEKAGG